MFGGIHGSPALYYAVVTASDLCFDHKYINLLFETGEYENINFLTNQMLLVENDNVRIAIMAIRKDDIVFIVETEESIAA